MDQHIQEVAIRCYEALDSAHSLSCAILLRNNEYDQLTERVSDPHQYLTAASYYKDASANDLLRKYPSLPTSFDKATRAMEVWRHAEQQCFRTNRFITDAVEGEKPSTQVINLLDDLRKITSDILGRVPERLNYRFGPGATYANRGVLSLLPNKLSVLPEMTSQAWVFLRDVSQSAWFRCLQNTAFEQPALSVTLPCVRGNRFITVPKDSKVDRAIAIEPSLNVFVQLGIGDAMRHSLNRRRLLLSNSQEIHRELARKGSLDGSLTTLDLSSASDTVSYQLVKYMVPDNWFSLLDASRSPFTQLPSGNWVHLEKFSSMGNGYTFELETLLFTAICVYAAGVMNVPLTANNFSVYGDDIIIPDSLTQIVSNLLRMLGFTLNPRKSFSTSPFRESCGGDFFYGESVRPVQVKTEPRGPGDLFSLHNQLMRNEHLVPVAAYVRTLLPKRLRGYGGPLRLGDLCLHGVKPITRESDCITYVRVLQPYATVIPLARWDDYTAFASMLYGVPTEGVASRGAPAGYRSSWVTNS